MDILSLEVQQPKLGTCHEATADPRLSDPSLVPNVGPAGTCMSVVGPPLLAVERDMTQTSWSLAERIPKMYTVPDKDPRYEQSESALIEQGRVLLSDNSVRSQGSEVTLSPNQDGTFSYGAASEPVGSDIEPLIERQPAKFFQNLEQVDIVDAARNTLLGWLSVTGG